METINLERNVGNHFFNAGLVKGDFQFVAFGSDNGAVAKFLAAVASIVIWRASLAWLNPR